MTTFNATVKGGLPVEVEAVVHSWRDYGPYGTSDLEYEIEITDVRFPRRRGKQGTSLSFNLSEVDEERLKDLAFEKRNS